MSVQVWETLFLARTLLSVTGDGVPSPKVSPGEDTCGSIALAPTEGQTELADAKIWRQTENSAHVGHWGWDIKSSITCMHVPKLLLETFSLLFIFHFTWLRIWNMSILSPPWLCSVTFFLLLLLLFISSQIRKCKRNRKSVSSISQSL